MRRFFVPSSKYFYVFLSIVALSAYAFFVQAVQLPDGTAPSSGGYAVDEFILDPGCSPNDLVFDCYKNIAEPAWLLGGNAGTDGGTADFIGTTDAQDVVIKTNGNEIARFGQDHNSSFGEGTFAKSYGETVAGLFNTDYTPTNATGFAAADRLFTVGNGTGIGTESDAFTILKNGNAAIGVNNFEADADAATIKLKINGSIFAGQGNLAWASGEETKMFLNTTTRAFRMGSVDNTTWEGANVGARSIAMGFANVGSGLRAPRASGAYAIAIGTGSSASAPNSIAIGHGASVGGQYGVAIGHNTTAGSSGTAMGEDTVAGSYSTAFGYNTDANGPYSTAFGVNTSALWASTAFGSNSTATGFNSTAFGDNTLAAGGSSTAFGTFTRAENCSGCTAFGSGTSASVGASTSFGYSTIASGDGATAFGNQTQATSGSATAFGDNTIASGSGSTAFGDNTTASGSFATAFGSSGIAEGDFATVFGVAGTAPSYAETVIGFYPTMYTANNATVADAGDRIFTIGNGVDDIDRHDTFTVLKSGLTGIGYDNFETTANTELLQVNGLIRSTGSLVTSDSRLKNTVNSISYGLATINQLRPVSYNLNSDGSHQLGFIAQEVQPVLPELVAEGNYLALNYIGFIPVLTKAVQELDVKISNINAQAATLFTNQGFLDGMIAWLANSANGIQKLFTHEVHTDTLCVGNTCVTETELQQLLQQNNVSVPPPAIPPIPEPDPVPDIVPTPDEEVAPDPAPEPNPEVVPDPIPEPAPEPVI